MSDSTGQIIDLTEEKIYDLDIKKKTYKVTTFAQLRAEMEKARREAEQSAREAARSEPSRRQRRQSRRRRIRIRRKWKSTST